MTPLDFASIRDSESDSWERADPQQALVEIVGLNEWRVTLPDGASTHVVSMDKHRNGAYTGECHTVDGEQCAARKYNDRRRPCAHLATIRKALLFNDPDARGTPIRCFDRARIERESVDAAIEQSVRATTDGGRIHDND
jgi:hypothetical protein